jgi:hypothetical protein
MAVAADFLKQARKVGGQSNVFRGQISYEVLDLRAGLGARREHG